ncbi:MAG: 23S rRNA (adenine(2503)-C(2))-methyltransferase RlmN, partial [Candidatus Binatia bacterium]
MDPFADPKTKPNIKDLSCEGLGDWLSQRREPPYRTDQIRRWLFQKGATSFDEMTNLSAGLRAALEEEFSISRLKTLRSHSSQDGTVKFLFGLADTLSIESVLIPETKRLTLCISTQAGCGLGCSFCATAKMGLKRNLQASEILDQILEAGKWFPADKRITHVVLMGMGEPLANYAQTLKALQIMTDARSGMGISPRRTTLSTVGLVPQIKRLMEETRINLAISLHATTDNLRSQLMPVNRRYPLGELIHCCRSLPIPKRRRITFEYVLLRGINHSPKDARRLSKLLNGVHCKINLIPFNPHPGTPYQRPTQEEIQQFQDALRARGHQVNVREPRGDDIQAACGQLQGEHDGKDEDGRRKDEIHPSSFILKYAMGNEENNPKKIIGVIGGSGLYQMEGLEEVREVQVKTPFGKPSDAYVRGILDGTELVFLPRHGKGHRWLPTEVNFRANIFGMKKLGVERIISVSAVGSLREEIAPGHVVIPDQFIDRTTKRPSTFFGRGIVAHVSFADPLCSVLSEVLARAAGQEGARVHPTGTYICMEGPQFSTRAESLLYRSWGAHVIGMTNLQEAKLAREAE